MKVLADRLKWLRDKKRLAQKEVAGNIGLTLSGYQKIEYNESNPKIETLVKMVNFFNESSDFLLGIDDSYSELVGFERKALSQKKKVDQIFTHLESLKTNIKIQRDVMKSLGETQEDIDAKIENSSISNELDYYEIQYMEEKSVLNRDVSDLIFLYYSIPSSNPQENLLIKEYLPVTVKGEEFSEGNYRGYLYSLSKQENLQLLFWFQGDEKNENKLKYEEALDKYKSLFRINH